MAVPDFARRSTVGRVYHHRRVLRIMVQRDLRVRYAQSFLGYLWTILDPLAMSLVYFVVFALIFKRAEVGYSPYFLFLITGLLPWQWFNASVVEGARALLAEAKLVRSTRLPRELWVARVVIAKGIEFVLSLPVLIVFTIAYIIRGEAQLDWQLVLVPVGMALQFVLLIGLGLLLSPIQVLVNDTQPVVRIVLRVLFYGTPIIYTVDHAPGWLATVLWFNPMSGILEFYRAGFFQQALRLEPIVISVVMCVGIFVLGRFVFKRLERSVLKEI
ncbi:ABC transporter permease [Microlunatus sp. Y2014]|uniref:ABC transporter permease n=1 Tax=Microlunatus sp. Y2014 TaxID=3418488 RepID=UPI003DA78F2E